jgi:hypothetical protein
MPSNLAVRHCYIVMTPPAKHALRREHTLAVRRAALLKHRSARFAHPPKIEKTRPENLGKHSSWRGYCPPCPLQRLGVIALAVVHHGEAELIFLDQV